MTFGETELLAYMRSHRLAVVASIGANGAPQSALVGIAVSSRCELVFDTTSDTRKHANLTRDPRAAVVLTGPGEQTLQLEGIARPVSVTDAAGAAWRDIYEAAWPDAAARRSWPHLAYWRIVPHWARYCDYGRGPLIREFEWPQHPAGHLRP